MINTLVGSLIADLFFSVASYLKSGLRADANEAVFMNFRRLKYRKMCHWCRGYVIRYVKNGKAGNNFVSVQEPVITVTAIKSLKPTTSSLTKEEFLASADNKLIWINSFGAAAMSENKSGILMQFKYVIHGLVYTHFVSDLMELAIFDLAKIDDNYLKKLN